MAPQDSAAHALRRRIGELEQRNQDLERRIARAGEILGEDALAMAGRANAWLAAIVESSDDAIISKDLTGIITTWNRAAERLYGYTAGEMVGQPVQRIVPRELHDEEERILAKVRAGERIEHFRTTRIAKDGERLEVEISVSPVRNLAGAIIGASKVARDMRLVNEADRAKATLAAIVTGSDDAIISKTLDGIVTSWNPAAERLYGYTADEMVGQSILKIIPVHLYFEEDHILSKIRLGERIDHFETRRVRKDGRIVEVSLTVSPLRDSLGRLIGASKIARDITAQREGERRKDEFLAVLAHELRNPLAPIRNAIALFGQPHITRAQQERARAIAERQFQHMSRLLDDLLDVSRLNRGHVELKRQRIELRGLVEQSVEATRSLVAERAHELRLFLAEEALWLDADPVRITQVVSNLLTNAAKYTDARGVISLATRREGNEAVVEVIDNGIGFDAEMHERLFVLFSQARDAQSRAAGGLGIGLALVRQFVERHGGTVAGESGGPGKGSRFVVRLPLVD